MAVYTSTRPRGLAPWNPNRKTLALLEQVDAVLDEFRDYLPVTLRQIFYRLVGAHGYEKTERAYKRLCEAMVRARRSERIRFSSIRDDGTSAMWAGGYSGPREFWEGVRQDAEGYERDPAEAHLSALELWCEAEGMMPQLYRVAAPLGVTVFSSGGFDSLTAKYEAATRIADRSLPTVVLHVGDLDPSGVSIFDAAAEDVGALVEDLAGWAAPQFVRVAVTREQEAEFSLPSAPPKATDRRGDWAGETVQAEALTPPQLAGVVRAAILDYVDEDELERIREEEAEERTAVVEELERLIG